MKKLLFLFALISIISCDDSMTEPMEEGVVWDGAEITFTKADGSDPTLEANQDRITDNVWITRANDDGGQIYNIQSETVANKDSSPEGTLWAKGELSNAENLDYKSFREALDKPKDAVGENLVMFLVEEKAYVSVVINSWSQNRLGGFSYTRSTEN